MDIITKIAVLTIPLFSGVLLSCEHNSSLIKEGRIKFVEPEKVMSVDPDTSLSDSFREIPYAYNLQIINDSILIIHSQSHETESNQFIAYDMGDYHRLGSFVKQGRGPGEILEPWIVPSDARQKGLYVRDNASGAAYIIDVMRVLGGDNEDSFQEVDIPDGTVDWAPLNSTNYLLLVNEHNELTIQLTGTQKHTFHPYRGLNADRYIPKFSSILTGNEAQGKLAYAMLCFPQIAIIDYKSKEIHSSAVDPSYKNWESILKSQFSPESMQYYRTLTSSDKYIIALYDGCSLSDTASPSHIPTIHIFDWEGRFLYELRVRENIGAMSLDSCSSYLYCIDNSSGQIIRYDLSGILGE